MVSLRVFFEKLIEIYLPYLKKKETEKRNYKKRNEKWSRFFFLMEKCSRFFFFNGQKISIFKKSNFVY